MSEEGTYQLNLNFIWSLFIYLSLFFFIFIALDSSFVTSKLIALVQFYTSII